MAITLRSPLVVESDFDLVRAGSENPGYQIERDIDGGVIVSPTSTDGGAKSGEAFGQLRDYAKRAGGRVFDSNTGFAVGPGQRVLSPDASYLSIERIEALGTARRETFWPISPDIAIEVRSKGDTFAETIAKIEIYTERGSRYAVAIDPFTREVVVRGTPPHNFVLDTDAVIDA